MDGAPSTAGRRDGKLKWRVVSRERLQGCNLCVHSRLTLAVSETRSGSRFPLSCRLWHALEEPSLK